MTRYKVGDIFSVSNIIDLGKDLSTFKMKGFQIEGEKAIHPITKEAIPIKTIVNEIRNVRDENGNIIAKRFNPTDELRTVSLIKKKK